MRLRFASALLALLSLLGAPVALAQDLTDLPAPLQDAIETARTDCAGFENGTLDIPWDAVARTDLTGNGETDLVLDLGKLACSSAASLYCGTGGCTVLFSVGDTLTERLSKGWTVQRFAHLTVLLNQIHGANCGGTNLNACVEALVWDDPEQRFFTLAE